MNDIEEKIKERTQSTVEKTIERAKKIKERELAIARKKKETIVSEESKKQDKIINVRRNSLKAQLILKYRLKEDNFKDKLCSELLDEIKKSLDSLDDNILFNSLKNLIRESIVSLGLNKALIKVNKKSATLIKERYNEVINFIKEKMDNFEDINIDDSLETYGVVVASDDTEEFFDNTFKRRLERFEEEFKEKILERLGGYGR